MSSDVIEGEYKALAVREEPLPPTLFSPMRPADKVAFAASVADALRPILTAKKLVKHLNDRNPDDEFVELEGWQTCATLCGCAAKIEWTRELADGMGYEARAVVVRVDSGVEIGAGEGMCSKAERNWAKRDDYARKGMAQTRAQSRALRGVLAWILVLAGYKPTPAEEMPPTGKETPGNTVAEPRGQYNPAKPGASSPKDDGSRASSGASHTAASPVSATSEAYTLTAEDRAEIGTAQKTLGWDNRTLGDFIAFVLGSDRRTLHDASAEEVEQVKRGLRLRVAALEDEMAREADDSVGGGLRKAEDSSTFAGAADGGSPADTGAPEPLSPEEHALAGMDLDDGPVLFRPSPTREMDLGPAQREAKALRMRMGVLATEMGMTDNRRRLLMRRMFVSTFAQTKTGEESSKALSLAQLQSLVRHMEDLAKEQKAAK